MMSLEVTRCEDAKESCQALPKVNRKLQRCVEMCISLKDRKILVSAHGLFVISLGVVLLVGHFVIEATTTSTVHTRSSIPTAVTSVLAVFSGFLFASLVFKKQRYLIITTTISSTVSGILSAIGAVHYGITVTNRLMALSDCVYTSYERLCACSVVTSSSRVTYNFENTVSCAIITKHLREVAYGMCGVYAVTFVSCFGAAVYAILLAHKLEIRRITNERRDDDVICKEKQPLDDEHSAEILQAEDSKKSSSPWRQDVSTQTASRSTGNDASCRHQCRHFVEVTVPDTNNDFVVNITKSSDPPPPYCETVYT
ncbi:uncharacterized protein LOC114525381 [Dendronephthya gigantea]|uniref:uncharacterized protein LOC114525381 n=1 Tax=Dendronephthya gigantea TaxID=151771 RepID=UPI00106D3836|nr:uncharacterized protein LOC114525381 [Dendronephthya gigantea]